MIVTDLRSSDFIYIFIYCVFCDFVFYQIYFDFSDYLK